MKNNTRRSFWNQRLRTPRRLMIVLFCIVLVSAGQSALQAQSQAERGNCGLISVDARGEIAFPLMVVPGEARLSSNPGGKTRVECSGRMPEGPYKQVTLDYAVTEKIIGTGISCFTPWGEATRDWRQVVSPSGEATLICHLNGHSKP